MSHTPESRFADRLAELTGANVSKIAAVSGVRTAENAHPVEAETSKLASLSLAEIMESPDFLRGFEARVEERRGEIEAAIGAVEIG